ncbi:MAG: acyltransferase [Parcubacteria group bacterium]|jgi:acetyltransferase-like isoleucine patch superfamily enzyme
MEKKPNELGEYCKIFDGVIIGADTRIGNFVFIRPQTEIGSGCIIGSFVDIEGDVKIGSNTSIQSGCYITRGVIVEDEVFLGPRVITMNDKKMTYHRKNLTFQRNAPKILRGARVGGGSVLLPGVTVGRNALVGAGSVVTKDVPDEMIVCGNPAKVVGQVSQDELL